MLLGIEIAIASCAMLEADISSPAVQASLQVDPRSVGLFARVAFGDHCRCLMLWTMGARLGTKFEFA